MFAKFLQQSEFLGIKHFPLHFIFCATLLCSISAQLKKSKQSTNGANLNVRFPVSMIWHYLCLSNKALKQDVTAFINIAAANDLLSIIHKLIRAEQVSKGHGFLMKLTLFL